MLYLLYQEKRKEGDNMSANVYTVENLLVGKTYNSSTLKGEIISAEKHPQPFRLDEQGAGWVDLSEATPAEILDLEIGLFQEGAL